MARIRTIKPEFFTSEDIVSMTPLARLFYVALWCEADREGRLSWKPKTLKMRYLPGDECDIDALSAELVKAGMIAIYEVDGKQYAEIPSFKNHQVINNRESESTIPARVVDASARVKAEGRKGKEGTEGKGMEGTSAPTGAGGEPPAEMSDKDKIYAYGVPILVNAGNTDKAARSFLAGKVKDHGESVVVAALRDCYREAPIDPLTWLAKRLPMKGSAKPSAHAGFNKVNYREGINDDGSFA
jgi:hypothetical protein